MFDHAPAVRASAACLIPFTALAACRADGSTMLTTQRLVSRTRGRFEIRDWQCGEEAATQQACTGSGMTGN
jgi:hypothetical protein